MRENRQKIYEKKIGKIGQIWWANGPCSYLGHAVPARWQPYHAVPAHGLRRRPKHGTAERAVPTWPMSGRAVPCLDRPCSGWHALARPIWPALVPPGTPTPPSLVAVTKAATPHYFR